MKQKKSETLLTKEGILKAAITLADKKGIASLTLRKLAAEIGIEAMSLYHYFANKDQILDGMVDTIFSSIDLPPREEGWKTAIRRRAISARKVLTCHSWALNLVDSRRNPGPATLRHHNAVLGCLRSAGFTVSMTAHAVSLIDSYIYGFVLQEQNLRFSTPNEIKGVATPILEHMSANDYPYLMELGREHVLNPGYVYAEEFEYGLNLVLNSIEKIFRGDA